jgi:transcriptional regulator with XRE-family HTH domain
MMGSPIENVSEQLRRKFPAATIAVHAPVGNGRVWWMDLTLGPTRAEVEWSPSRGFGVSVNSEAVFGAQADEVFSSASAVISRLVDLIESGKQTEDSSERFIRALREGRKLTQTQLAKLLKVKQASVSRLESRADFHVSTLRSIVARLGGSLELRASFPDGSVHILQYSEKASPHPQSKISGGAGKGARNVGKSHHGASTGVAQRHMTGHKQDKSSARRARPNER